MSYSKEEFQFTLEMIIANRNEHGTTLSDIQADYNSAFGESLESMFGSSWSDYLRNWLSHSIDNVFMKQAPGGYTLYFIREAELLKKVDALSNNENIKAILHKLNIDPNNIKARRAAGGPSQSSFNSTGMRWVSSFQGVNSSQRASLVQSAPPKLAEFYNHTLIGDNFFLELSHIDLQLQKTKKKNIERIGLCISGQSIKSACRTISYSPYQFSTKYVILNIGTFDLLNGRSVEQIIADIVRLLNVIQSKGLKAILTTLAPLPNHLGNEIEERRKAINKFMREEFEFIDIESCFLSNGSRVLRECYQEKPRTVGGSSHPVLLWNRVGRQRALQLMKREIPNIHPLF
ncbi:hypothetical protein HA402_007265 [Bradysia odoriphaga]|nr:hypothetical protein HA402_007265 [Bradysia odoriphaga]